jgi:hypothetical protein
LIAISQAAFIAPCPKRRVADKSLPASTINITGASP